MKVEIKVPAIGESINEVTIGQWLVEDGAQVDEDQVICEIESEKATVEITAEQSGVIKKKAQEGDIKNIGDIIAELDTGKAGTKSEDIKSGESLITLEEINVPKIESHELSPEKESQNNRISPVAANILREAGISDENIQGSGQGGKIIKADALKALSIHSGREETKNISASKTKPKLPETKQIKEEDSTRSERREKMSTLRKTLSKRLLQAKQGTAMLTTMNEVDMSAINELRKKYKEKFKEKYNVNLGFMSFFTKAVCVALNDFPMINAQIDNEEIVYFNYCDISIAVSTPRGLVVPVIRNAEKLSFAEIELKIAELAEKARDGKLTIEEMSGGTFSITNGGVFGSLLSTPLINSPQSAILGMHTIQERPVARNGQIIIKPMMYLALSYDHRIIDGKESVSFLIRLKEILEDPIHMILFV